MNKHLQNITNIIHLDESLTEAQKDAITKSLKDAELVEAFFFSSTT